MSFGCVMDKRFIFTFNCAGKRTYSGFTSYSEVASSKDEALKMITCRFSYSFEGTFFMGLDTYKRYALNCCCFHFGSPSGWVFVDGTVFMAASPVWINKSRMRCFCK
jgi:hypothetical protein